MPPPIADLFCAPAAIPSPSGAERAVGEYIRAWLRDRGGVSAQFDRAGELNGSDAGNLVATVPGGDGRPRMLFVAHMDTVETGAEPVRPQLGEDGVIRSAGDTILGADNKSAVAAVMALCASTAAMDPATRPTVVAAFTCREESGRMGAGLLDLAAHPIDCAFSVDGSRPIGTVITRALGQRTFTAEIAGRAAHAAAAPQDGVDAIAVAAEAITHMQLGRLAAGGSACIAAIAGGSALQLRSPAELDTAPTNSVAARALLRGEIRGYSDDELTAARAQLHGAVRAACERRGATFAWRDREPGVPPFPGAPDSRALALARAAADATPGATYVAEEAHATLEANYLAAATDVVALASGGRDPHQTSESITVGELQTLEALLAEIVRHA